MQPPRPAITCWAVTTSPLRLTKNPLPLIFRMSILPCALEAQAIGTRRRAIRSMAAYGNSPSSLLVAAASAIAGRPRPTDTRANEHEQQETDHHSTSHLPIAVFAFFLRNRYTAPRMLHRAVIARGMSVGRLQSRPKTRSGALGDRPYAKRRCRAGRSYRRYHQCRRRSHDRRVSRDSLLD